MLNTVETRRPTAIMFRGRLWSVRHEVGDATCASFALLECAVKHGEELELSLDSGIMVVHFSYAFQYLVVRECAELGSSKVTAEALDSPNDANGFQLERGPMAFRVNRSSADICDGFMEPSFSCSRAAPNLSLQASQYTWNRR